MENLDDVLKSSANNKWAIEFDWPINEARLGAILFAQVINYLHMSFLKAQTRPCFIPGRETVTLIFNDSYESVQKLRELLIGQGEEDSLRPEDVKLVRVEV